MSRDINEQYEPHDKDCVQEQDSKNKLGEKKRSICTRIFVFKVLLKGESAIQLCHVILTCEGWAYRYKYQ